VIKNCLFSSGHCWTVPSFELDYCAYHEKFESSPAYRHIRQQSTSVWSTFVLWSKVICLLATHETFQNSEMFEKPLLCFTYVESSTHVRRNEFFISSSYKNRFICCPGKASYNPECAPQLNFTFLDRLLLIQYMY